MSDPQRRVTYGELFAVREFRVLAGMTVLGALATTAEILGLSVLVYARTGSPLLSAIAFGIGFLPQLVGGALLTSLADRVSPRTLLVALLVVRALPGAAIGLLAMPVAAMLALVAVAASLDPVASASTGGLLPELLGPERYVLGRSVMHVAATVAQILGLAVGGVVLAILTPQRLLLVAAAFLVAESLAICRGLGHHPPRTTGERGGALKTTLAGNRALLSDRRIRGLLLAQWLTTWLVTGAESLLVSYVGALGRPAGQVTVLLVALPIGMIAGDVIVGRLCQPSTQQRLSMPLATLMGLPLIAFAAHVPVPAGAGLLVLTAAGFGYQLPLQRRFVAALPTELNGQSFGLLSAGMMGGQGLGPIAAGAVAALAGPGAAIAAAGGACILTAVALHQTLSGGQHHSSKAVRAGP
ncbi:MAG TPA: MFS transporter [Solirubrobacteraceae bacterium]|nr:MFS transporter [Solirubrobacteraceae bacterium]